MHGYKSGLVTFYQSNDRWCAQREPCCIPGAEHNAIRDLVWGLMVVEIKWLKHGSTAWKFSHAGWKFFYLNFWMPLLEFALVSEKAIKKFCLVVGGTLHPLCMFGGGGSSPPMYALWGVESSPAYVCLGGLAPPLLKVQSGVQLFIPILLECFPWLRNW